MNRRDILKAAPVVACGPMGAQAACEGASQGHEVVFPEPMPVLDLATIRARTEATRRKITALRKAGYTGQDAWRPKCTKAPDLMTIYGVDAYTSAVEYLLEIIDGQRPPV